MKKVTKLILMLCLILTGALCYANDEARKEKEKGEDGITIGMIEKSSLSSSDKSASIQASIDGHVLSVVFLENLGQVAIEVTTANGEDVDTVSINTPSGRTSTSPAQAATSSPSPFPTATSTTASSR